MKYIMMITVVLFMLFLPLTAQDTVGDQELMERAKLEIFDRHWDKALDKLERLLADYPDSQYYSRALFYKGRCLEKTKQSRKALAAYELFLKISESDALKEEATIAIIDINFTLYEQGEPRRLKQVKEYLDSRRELVRFYAAFKLSYSKDKDEALAAVPVLKRIIAEKNDHELVDRAKVALMRIHPDHLKNVNKKRNIDNQMFYIQAYDKKEKKETFKFGFPFMLAKLALDSLPEKDKKELKKEGYNLDRILRTLTESPEVLRIETEETIFKIWVGD